MNHFETPQAPSLEKEKIDGWGNLPERQPIDINIKQWSENLSPSDLVAIHVTNTFPSDGMIRTHVGWAEKTGEPGVARDTAHFTLNGVVQEDHGSLNLSKSEWPFRKFAVLTPLFNLPKEQVINMKTDDTFLLGDVEVPAGSKVLVDWKEIAMLRDMDVLSDGEMHELLRAQGMVDEYVQTDIDRERDNRKVAEKDGIAYVLCDMDSPRMREILHSEIESMGYRPIEMGSHGWTDGAHISNEVAEKYQLPSSRLHSDHESALFEDLSAQIQNTSTVVLDHLFFEIAKTLEDGFSYEIPSLIKHIEQFLEDEVMNKKYEIENIPDAYSRVKNIVERQYVDALE